MLPKNQLLQSQRQLVKKADLIKILEVRGVPKSDLYTIGYSVSGGHCGSTTSVTIWIDWHLGTNPLPHELRFSYSHNPKGYTCYGWGSHANAVVADSMRFKQFDDPYKKDSPAGIRIQKTIDKYKKWMSDWESQNGK